MAFNRKSEPKSFEGGAARPAEQTDPDTAFDAHAQLAESVIGNDLTIEGQSIADLHSAFLTVGEAATITGAIAANRVDVLGRVYGAIRGAHVVLHSSAQVEGHIHSQLLSIEQGASFEGCSRRVADPREIAPELEPAALSPPVVHAAPARASREPAIAGQGPPPLPMPSQRFRS